MRCRKTRLLVLCVAALLVTAPLCLAQVERAPGRKGTNEPYPEQEPWTEEDALRILERDRNAQFDPASGMFLSSEGTILDQDIWDDLQMAGATAARLKASGLEWERIVQAIVDFPIPSEEPGIGEAKMWALSPFKDNPAAHACVIETLQNPEPQIQKHAATVLFYWDEWELAIPIIHKYGYYEGLGYGKTYFRDPRLIPILQEGARSSPSWEGRTLAAYYLQNYGDSTTIVEVSKDVVMNAPMNTDDNSVARAKYTALRTLARYQIADAVSGIARLANDQNTLVRITVVDMLELYAYNGIEEARQALERIAQENADPNTRETAKAAVSRIGNREK